MYTCKPTDKLGTLNITPNAPKQQRHMHCSSQRASWPVSSIVFWVYRAYMMQREIVGFIIGGGVLIVNRCRSKCTSSAYCAA